MLPKFDYLCLSFFLATVFFSLSTQAQNLQVDFPANPFNQRNRLLRITAGYLVASQRANFLRAARRHRPRVGGGWGPLLGPNGERLDVYPFQQQGRMMALSGDGQELDRKAIIQQIYGDRAEVYDQSFHPLQAADFIEWAALKPGQNVLDLACGTGLVALLAKATVGSMGTVVGIDITARMLAQARRKAKEQGLNVLFINHDITNLSDVNLPYQFDVITCASAFVLLENQRETVKGWTMLLKPGGRIIIDVPTQTSQLAGHAIALAAQELGIERGWDSSWVTAPKAVQELLENAGLSAEVFVSRSYGSNEYDQEGGLEVLDRLLKGSFAPMWKDKRLAPKAKEIFVAEFQKRANAVGLLREDVWFYIGVGTKKE